MADEGSGEGKDRDPGAGMRQAAPYVSAVWQLIGASVLGVVAGRYSDKHWHTAPWGVLVLSVMGIGVGFYAFILKVQQLGKRKP